MTADIVYFEKCAFQQHISEQVAPNCGQVFIMCPQR